MTLSRIAEIILMQPSLLGKLNSYAMWQAFQLSNHINISGHTLDQYEIYHSIYR